MENYFDSLRTVFKNIVSSFTWVVFFFMFGLTVLVFISQKSAPGDITFGVKLGFEKVLVRTSRVMDNEITVQIELTKRRVQETEKVIASNHASESLTNLSNQVSTTEQAILTIKNPQKQQEAAKEYVTTLSTTQSLLENVKQQVTSSNESSSSSIPTVTVQPSIPITQSKIFPSPTLPQPSPTRIPTQAAQIASVTQPTITTQITQTQQQIVNTITTLNNLGKKSEKEGDKKNNKETKENKSEDKKEIENKNSKEK